jgi:hypothetical protein
MEDTEPSLFLRICTRRTKSAMPTTEPTATTTKVAMVLDLRRLSANRLAEASGPSSTAATLPSVGLAVSLAVGVEVGLVVVESTGLSVGLAVAGADGEDVVYPSKPRDGSGEDSSPGAAVDGVSVEEATGGVVTAAVGDGVGDNVNGGVVPIEKEKSNMDIGPSKPPNRERRPL